MNTHTNRKVVCIKDIPSNLIEEAIFIFFAIKKKIKAKIKTITKMFKQIKDNDGKTTSCMKVKSSFREP